MRENEFSVQDAVEFIRSVTDEEVHINDHGDGDKLVVARKQMDHPQFVQYVAAKMGAM